MCEVELEHAIYKEEMITKALKDLTYIGIDFNLDEKIFG